MIAVDENATGNGGSAWSWRSFTSGTNTGMYNYSSTTNYSVTNPGTADARTGSISQIQLEINTSYRIDPGSVSRLLATNSSRSDVLSIRNTSASNLSITNVTDGAAWLSYSPSLPITVTPSTSYDLDIVLDASSLAAGTYTTNLALTTSAGTISVPVSLRVISSTLPMNPRHIAQWEPAQGAIIRYPLGIPDDMIYDLWQFNDELFVVVASGTLATAQAYFQNTIGIPPADVTWITAPTDSYWIRDYGPISIYHGTGATRQLGIIDFGYNRTGRTNDNAVNAAICAALDIDYFYIDMSLTGGNILTDGMHREFADEWVYLQNDYDAATGNGTGSAVDPYNYQYTPTEFLDLVQLIRGDVTNGGFYTWPDPTNEYIRHIDCWAKLLSQDTVLIADGGTNNTALDEIAAEWANIISATGQPYTVIRVNCPDDQPYTNSYILNGRVYMPFMGTAAADQAALAVYQNAMPGYTVEGYLSRTGAAWVSTDAVHCRIHTIYELEDEDPLPIELSSFTATISADNLVNLTWVTQTETGVLGFYVLRNSTGELGTATTISELIEATNTSTQQTYCFKDSEVFDEGTYYYWLQNSDLDGTVAFHGPISILYAPTGNQTPGIPLVTELHPIYPNPFNPSAQIPFSLAENGNVSFEIFNSRGQLIRSILVGDKNPGYHNADWDGLDSNGQTCSTGVYHIRMKVGSSSYFRKAVLLK